MSVIAFKPRPAEVPALLFAEFRLSDGGDALELTVVDDAGDRHVLVYELKSRTPANFSLERLIDAWARWRQESPVAS